MVYEYKHNFDFRVDAQTVGEMCERLEKSVGLTPKNFVDASRPEDSPTHDLLEWDDKIAAEKHRESEAKNVIHLLVIKHEESPEPVRAFFNIVGETRKYVNYETVLKTPEYSDQLLTQARKDADAFIHKYNKLKQASDAIAALEMFVTRIDGAER